MMTSLKNFPFDGGSYYRAPLLEIVCLSSQNSKIITSIASDFLDFHDAGSMLVRTCGMSLMPDVCMTYECHEKVLHRLQESMETKGVCGWSMVAGLLRAR